MIFTTESAEGAERPGREARAKKEEDGLRSLSGAVIGAAIEVHRTLGPGLLESAYEACLAYELTKRGLAVEQQMSLPVLYKGFELDCLYRLDMVVEARVLLEIKRSNGSFRSTKRKFSRISGSQGSLLAFSSTSIARPSRKASAASGTPSPTLHPRRSPRSLR